MFVFEFSIDFSSFWRERFVWLLASFFHVYVLLIIIKKLKKYVSCEFNRSADRSILNFLCKLREPFARFPLFP